ncbi:response regulator receiver [Plesiocystis pacifica SIR-1]|uniref:Response regulator receiver n=2 Tax=Plesiocystis pacifica TaxID=191768 RepID=A6GEN2_9BACT|nr:response regulator receiver [Plesiocystis pacifica SIR-1]
MLTMSMHAESLSRPLSPLRDHPSFVRDTLGLLAEAVPHDMLSYNEVPQQWRVDPSEGEAAAGMMVWAPAAPTTSLNVDDQQALALRYLHEHPGRLRRGQPVVRNRDLCPPERWHRTTLYNELHRPLDIEAQCLVYLPAPSGLELVIAYSRARGSFSDAELERLSALQRGLSQTVLDHWRYLELQTERALWRTLAEGEARGVVYLDRCARVAWASPQACALLREYDLALAGSQLPKALKEWLAPVYRGRRETLPGFQRRGQGRVLAVELHPAQEPHGGGMLTIEARALPRAELPQAVADHVPQLVDGLGLTPRQAEVALWMSCGKTNAEISTILSIRPATVKKHVERILDRLGVENRTGAAKRVHDVVGAWA